MFGVVFVERGVVIGVVFGGLRSRVPWFGSLCINRVHVFACLLNAVIKKAVFAERNVAGSGSH